MSKTGDELCYEAWKYHFGVGVKKDVKKAFEYYKNAADIDYGEGLFWTGFCYHWNIGVEKDYEKAFNYYLKSAETGYNNGIIRTAYCYNYGVGVKKNRDESNKWLNKYETYLTRNKIGFFANLCNCDISNTCDICGPDKIIQQWTSGNKVIDDCLKSLQLGSRQYHYMMEWFPYSVFFDIEEIGKGGFGSVYKAKCDLTYFKNKNSFNYGCTPNQKSKIVVIKQISSDIKEFMNEFIKTKIGEGEGSTAFHVYGMTCDPKTNNYFLVVYYVKNGNFYNYLKNNFKNITWRDRIYIIRLISSRLSTIHTHGLIHADLHGGNILCDDRIDATHHGVFISDFGLSKMINEDSDGNIYGVLPYVAPEVLQGQPVSKASDMYALGIIMTELTTGQRPFDGYEFDTNLAVKIINGLRPEFAPETPDCYKELALKCIDSDPEKRPTSHDVYSKFYRWMNCVKENNKNIVFKEEYKEAKQFVDADRLDKKLSSPTPKHEIHMYTSKVINTRKIRDIISRNIKTTEIPYDI